MLFTMQDLSTKLAIVFKNKDWLEKNYQDHRGVFLHSGAISSKGLILDLNSLPHDPIDFKTIFIKWMIDVNAPRLMKEQDPIMTLELALKCPIFKVIKPPIRKLDLTSEGLFNRPSLKTSGQKQTPGSINKR